MTAPATRCRTWRYGLRRQRPDRDHRSPTRSRLASSQSFAYDALIGWLEQADGAYGTIDYAYDALGNRLSRTITDGGTTVTESYSLRRLQQPPAVGRATAATTRSFGYAADGSVTSDDRGADVFDLTYDAAGRLAERRARTARPRRATPTTPSAAGCCKDLGRLRHATHFDLRPGRPPARRERTPARRSRNTSGCRWTGRPGRCRSRWSPMPSTAGPRLHYLHTDHLGTPGRDDLGRLRLSSNGQAALPPVRRGRTPSPAAKSLDAALPGQLFDPETGFHQNFWHRDYDPTLGPLPAERPDRARGRAQHLRLCAAKPRHLRKDPGWSAGSAAAQLASGGWCRRGRWAAALRRRNRSWHRGGRSCIRSLPCVQAYGRGSHLGNGREGEAADTRHGPTRSHRC